MKKYLSDRIPFARIMTVLAIALGISLGLCGVGIAASGPGNGSKLQDHLLHWTLYVGVWAFWLSAAGLILCLAFFVILRLWDEARGRGTRGGIHAEDDLDNRS